MSATLRYLSYVRRGLARSIGEQADASGLPRSAVAEVDVTVAAAGQPIDRTMTVRGPGSVVGLAPGEVVRVDPLDGARDHAPNLFPSVDLRSADLPWLFTPARPRDDRLIPWLVLVVVEVRDGVALEEGGKALSVDDAGRELPDLTEAWAWAHVQVYADYTDLAALLADTPELATARLLCPRYLEPDTGYLACLVPSFEAGRLAGLGLDPPADSVALAWTADSSDLRLPVLHSWSFRTAPDPADFEDLVRRLEPRPLGPEVGVHDLDLSDPGTERLPKEPVTVGYEGALGSPEMDAPPWRDPEREAFRSAMGALLAEAAPGEPRAEGEPYVAARHDPVVSPPRYGALPAGIDRIPEPREPRSPEAPRWLSEANLDPKYRSAAGLGAEVVRRNQEALMADAWDQALGAGDVNGLLNRTRLALCVGQRSHARLEELPDGTLLQVTAGAHARLPGGVSGRTVRGRRPETTLPAGLVSAAFRRTTRAGGVLAKAVTSPTQDQAGATSRITDGFASDPDGMLVYATLHVPFGADSSPVQVDVDFPAAGLGGLQPGSLHPVASREVGSVFGPLEHDVSGLGTAVISTGDLGLGTLAGIVRERLEPTAMLEARVRALVEPAASLGDEPVPASMGVSPELRQPLYRKLVSIDPELLMPGIGSLPPDSVGLAVINQPSVEAFLLGANHEFSRELAWREYPADLAGTWLRTFWDSVGAAEDIPPVDAWTTGPLGTHAATATDPGQVLVLVIKGDLLRRYPNTLVTAVPARWRGGERVEDTRAEALDPIFSGTLGPDASFIGFEFEEAVDVEDDVPGTTENRDAPGWYFAFEEPPTEPAFGLDTEASDETTALEFWKDLTRGDVRGSPSGTHVSLESLGATTLPYDEQGENDWEETWAESAAGMARITLQRPVRMLVHADQMLVVTEAGANA